GHERLSGGMIRAMTASDAGPAADLWLEASVRAHDFVADAFWRSNHPAMAGQLLPQSEGLVHLTDGRLDGFICWKDDFVLGLFVHPGSQRRGIGSALLEHLKQDRSRLSLHVYQQNPAALAFYESRGFVTSGRSTCPHTGCAEIVMEWTAG
ncbi:MAG: GNAT family N-acetyltransferase, partial [Verrucomicrobiales bacterium]